MVDIDIHHQEKEQFKKLFGHDPIDRFEDRLRILEVFLKCEDHLTENELLRELHDHGYDYAPDLVKDTLDLMCHYGFAQTRNFENGAVRYEPRHLSMHHDHMICLKCGKIMEFKDETLEELQVKIAEAHGFRMLQHKMELYGVCSDCFKNRPRLIPLSITKPGERFVIKELTSGSGSRMRLLTMGLRVGDKIEIISNSSKGEMVIAADYNRYAIGRGIARKIMVQAVDTN